jgi:hypothetical protein
LECQIFGRDEDHLEKTTNPKIQKQKGRENNSYSKHMECPTF